jgi:hypothetical protein
MKSRLAVRIGVVMLGLAMISGTTRVLAAQADPQFGTWVLQVDQSKFVPGPPPKSQSVVYAAAGQGMKVVVTATDATGKQVSTEFVTTFDGKESPTKGNPDYDSVTAKRVDSHTMELTLKRAGKQVQTVTRTVSKDGKSATVTVTGVNVKGEKVNNVFVYTRSK